jgi:hypothetical protein
MKALTKGHLYHLPNFENEDEGQLIQFIEKKPSEDVEGELVTVKDGTTNEAVLKMLIDRLYYLQEKFSCRENEIVITKLEESLMWLNKRTEDRKKRGVEGKHLK